MIRSTLSRCSSSSRAARPIQIACWSMPDFTKVILPVMMLSRAVIL